MKPRITVVTIGVDDLERAVRFYRDGLGFESSPVWCSVRYAALTVYDAARRRERNREAARKGPTEHPLGGRPENKALDRAVGSLLDGGRQATSSLAAKALRMRIESLL